MELFEIKDLGFKYALGNRTVFEGVSFSVEEGQWVCIAGETGCGKTTLLKLLKRELTMTGELKGDILFEGTPLKELSARDSASKIGYVCQNPSQQIVTDKVWHELSFGLENLGVKNDIIKRQVAELASYFGIEAWYDKNTAELSGGQKQILNLASVMVMNPKVVLLDEPTAQLDPIATENFIAMVDRLHRDFGLTVIMVEHSLDKVLPLCDRVVVLGEGKLQFDGKVDSFIENIGVGDAFFEALPAGVRLSKQLGKTCDYPLNIGQSRSFLREYIESSETYQENCGASDKLDRDNNAGRNAGGVSGKSLPALEIKNVFFAYDKNSADVLKDFCVSVNEGEIYSILGGNGSGKSTALMVAAGLLKPYAGKVKIFGKAIKSYKNEALYNECLTMLPQDVTTMFLYNTVGEELDSVKAGIKDEIFDFTNQKDMHPYDLSGGQQQILGLAKALSTNPKILLIDEPTKGLDFYWKNKVADIITKLKKKGLTVIVISHDADFAAKISDRCAFLFKGEIVSVDEPHVFFDQNNFFTTDAVKISQGITKQTIFVDEIVNSVRV